MFKDFKEANKYLETLIPHGYTYNAKDALKLDRIEYLLKLLGNPHKKVKFIHITGTSGKGSVAHLTSQVLTGLGYKTGLHISPHLQSVAERAQINNKPISLNDFLDSVNRIKKLVPVVEKDLGLGKPTYFEVNVAIALNHFAHKKIDVAVVEVGMGGTYDATNVITPLVSIITNVSLDHTSTLGNTVQKIAKEKSGIIKKGVPVVSGARQLAVKKIIAKKSAENNSPVFFINDKFDYRINKVGFSGVNFDFLWLGKTYKKLTLSTPAVFQAENASIALSAIMLLKKQNFKINNENLHRSLAKATVPGRFEIIEKDPITILDGAHNPEKMKTFVTSLKKVFSDKKFIFLLAFKKGKNIEDMLRFLVPCAKTFVLTEFARATDMGKHFSTPPADIKMLINKLKFSGEIIMEKDSTKALQKAKKLAGKNTPLVVTGSIYLVGEIRDIFLPNK